MPNYRGLDVLQYECDVLKARNTDDEIQILVFKDASYLSQADRDRLVELYQSSIDERSAKIETYSNMISGYSKDNDSASSHISYDPLEYLYQEFLRSNLKPILRKIEIFFENYREALLCDSIVHLSSSARKIAVHSLHHHSVGSIIQEYLLNAKIKELESPLGSTAKSKIAIQTKYDYFADRIQCCLEIGNKIRELSCS